MEKWLREVVNWEPGGVMVLTGAESRCQMGPWHGVQPGETLLPTAPLAPAHPLRRLLVGTARSLQGTVQAWGQCEPGDRE